MKYSLLSLVPTRFKEAGQSILSNRLFRHSSWLFFGGIFTTALGLLENAIVARTLGVEKYGIFAVIITSSGIIMLVLDFRTWEIMPRVLSQYEKQNALDDSLPLVQRLLLIDFVVGMLGVLLVFLLAQPLADHVVQDSGVTRYIRIYAISVPATIIINGAAVGTFRFYDRYEILAKKAVSARAVAVLVIALAAFVGDLEAIVWAYVLTEIGHFIVTIVLLNRLVHQEISPMNGLFKVPTKLRSRQPIWGLLKQEWISGTLKGFQDRIELLLLGALAGPSQVGLYRAGHDIAVLVDRIGNPIQSAVLPDLARHAEREDRDSFLKTCRQASIFSAIAVLPIATVFTLFPKHIITFFFGSAYSDLSPILVILVWTVAINNIFIWVRPAIIALGKIHLGNWIGVITLALLVISALVLIPRAEGIGAALAFSIRVLAGTGLYFFAVLFNIPLLSRSSATADEQFPRRAYFD